MRRPIFCATLIHGSIRLTAATSPSRNASIRFGIVPALVVLMCSGVEEAFHHLQRGEMRAVVRRHRDRLVLQLLGLVGLESGATTMAKDDIDAPSATILRRRKPSVSASTARFMMPHSHMRYWSMPPSL